jgi:NTE family protein
VIGRLLDRLRDLVAPSAPPTRALVLSGGGARSAYQAGALQYIAETFPDASFPVMTGVSAGAINTAHLANQTGPLSDASANLIESWTALRMENVFRVESSLELLWGLVSSSPSPDPERHLTAEDVRSTHGLLDTSPLSSFLKDHLDAPDGVLDGVHKNLKTGRLRAVAVITTNYATGQTVTWVQGEDFDEWERPNRIGVHDQLTVDHVMASTSIPLVFPAVRIDDAWYGDGGIRLSAPLAPAVHLGANRILAVSNRYRQTRAEADEPVIHGYPPAAQIIGLLMNSVFMDALEQDAHTLARVNRLVRELPRYRRHGMRPIRLLRLRPSVDLGKLAHDYQGRIPTPIRYLTTGLGTGETVSPDWLSVLLFDPDYIDRLIDIGYHDARHQHDEIETFLADDPVET